MRKTNCYRVFYIWAYFAAAVSIVAAGPVQIGGDDGWYSTGSYAGDGVNPAEFGDLWGSFSMWYPNKAAFRAGWFQDIDVSSEKIGNGSTAFGGASVASGLLSFAMGDGANALGRHSSAFGHGIRAETYNAFVSGRFNEGGGSPSEWRSADPLFEVGNGSDANNRSNAITVYKDGDVHVHNGVIRVYPSGDIGMGVFTPGTQP